MFTAIAVGAVLGWGVIDGSPYLLEWMLRMEQPAKQERQLTEQEQLELELDQRIVASGQRKIQ